MNYDDLIIYGKELILKGRRPDELRSAIRHKAQNTELAEAVLKELFRVDSKPTQSKGKKYSLEVIRANRHYSNLHWSIKTLYRIPAMLLVVGAVVLVLSRKGINDNHVYGIMTCVSALVLFPLYYMAKRDQSLTFLMAGAGVSVFLFAAELLRWGIPNDFLKGYDQYNVQYSKNGYLSRMLMAILPWVYLGLRCAFLFLIIRPVVHWRTYDRLPNNVKEQLEEMNRM